MCISTNSYEQWQFSRPCRSDAASTFRFEDKLQRTKRQQNQQNYGQAMEERQRAEWDRAERERLRREKCKQKKQQQVRPTNPPSPGQTMPIRDNCEPYPAREQTYPIPCPQPCPPAPQPQPRPMPCPQVPLFKLSNCSIKIDSLVLHLR